MPLSEGTARGQWIALGPEASQERLEAFTALRQAMIDIDNNQMSLHEMLQAVVDEEAE